MDQAQLFAELAFEREERRAKLYAFEQREVFIDVLVAAGLVKRT